MLMNILFSIKDGKFCGQLSDYQLPGKGLCSTKLITFNMKN